MSKSVICLVVEDERELGEIMQDWLEDLGIKSQLAVTLQEANSRLRNQQYDLIVSDINLPGGSGSDLINRLRADTKSFNQKAPVIVTSGHLDMDTVTALKGLIQGVFVKPVDPSKFKELVKQILGNKLLP